jgi:hypothetical protein
VSHPPLTCAKNLLQNAVKDTLKDSTTWKITDILGQIDGQVEKIQIMQRFIVKVLNDNGQKFNELVRKSETLFHELDILTGQDLFKARRLHGPCLQCLEGKMRDTKMSKQSVTPPAKEVGEHIHADLIPIRNKIIGGNTLILFAVMKRATICN